MVFEGTPTEKCGAIFFVILVSIYFASLKWIKLNAIFTPRKDKRKNRLYFSWLLKCPFSDFILSISPFFVLKKVIDCCFNWQIQSFQPCEFSSQTTNYEWCMLNHTWIKGLYFNFILSESLKSKMILSTKFIYSISLSWCFQILFKKILHFRQLLEV